MRKCLRPSLVHPLGPVGPVAPAGGAAFASKGQMQPDHTVELAEKSRRQVPDGRPDPLHGNGADLFCLRFRGIEIHPHDIAAPHQPLAEKPSATVDSHASASDASPSSQAAA